MQNYLTFIPWLLALAIIADCQNVDIDHPILREVSGLASDSLFGYSLVLHQTTANPSTMAQALNGARYNKLYYKIAMLHNR